MYGSTHYKSAAQQPAAAAKATLNMRSFVDTMVASTQNEINQQQFLEAQNELEAQFARSIAAEQDFKVAHNQTFTIYREVEFKGTLRELAADPSKLQWKASNSPITLPVNARAIHMSTDAVQTQNTLPVSWLLQTKNIETNSTWTSNGLLGSINLKAFMRSPLQTNWNIFQRQNIESFDMSSLAGWNNVSEKTIEAEREEVVMHDGNEVAKLQYPGTVMHIIQKVLPNLTENDIMYLQFGDKVKVFVSNAIATKAIAVAKSLLKSTNFCDPNALEVAAVRSDGRAPDSLEGLVDSAPGLNTFQQGNILDVVGTISVTLKQTFALYMPSEQEVAAGAAMTVSAPK